MGYISIVGAAVPTEKLNKWLEEQNDPEITEFIDDLRKGEQTAELPEDMGKVSMTYLYSECIKWYKEDSVIEKFMELIGNLDYRECGFIRVGEDTDDIETDGCPYIFDIRLLRGIQFPSFKSQSSTNKVFH